MKKLLIALSLLFVGATASAATCEYKLVNHVNYEIERFTGFGYDRYDACRDAERDCRRVMHSGRYRAPRLDCVEVRRASRPIVNRTCTASLYRYVGGYVRDFIGRASGPAGTGIKGQACDRAIRQCRTFKSRNYISGYCEAYGRRNYNTERPRTRIRIGTGLRAL